MLKIILHTGRRFFTEKEGATAIEYGLIAALIALSLIAGATAIGKNVSANMECTATAIEKAETHKNPGKKFKRCVKRKSN